MGLPVHMVNQKLMPCVTLSKILLSYINKTHEALPKIVTVIFLITVKILKIWTSEKFAVITLKFEQ